MIERLFLALQQGAASPFAGEGAPPVAPAVEPTAKLFRFLFSTVPQWVQIAGILIGGPVAIIVAWQVWKHRLRIWAWFTARSRLQKAGLVGAIGAAGLVAAGAGLYNYNYVMHNNDFCSSCHIMDNAWNRFQVSAHKELNCHTCHRQPIWVSTKELYWWVLERRMAVPAHDKVPTAICSECHVQAAVDTSRSNVMRTAGHVLHLNSDSSALAKVECTSCHGRDFHLFQPNNATCAQSGCHTGTQVKLGAMSQSRFLHCTTCHNFRTRVPDAATEADAKKAVTPGALGCSACHQMSEQVLRWDIAADPHKGTCGSCHDPHKQEQPRDAFTSCVNCHASADTLTAFHRGLGAHALDQCGACHQAHSWKVKGNDCLACHKNIYDARPGLRRPETPEAPPARSVPRAPAHQVPSVPPTPGPATHGPPTRPPAPGIIHPAANVSRVGVARRIAPSPRRAARSQRSPRATAVAVQAPAARPVSTDTSFAHSRHRDLACTECHATAGSHGRVRITAPRDCLACHHGSTQKATCTTCHAVSTLSAKPQAVRFTVSARATPVTRNTPFAHARHSRLDCVQCHARNDRQTPTAKTCAGCHTEHHDAALDCASCHPTAKVGHDRVAHNGCAGSGCHDTARIAAAPPPSRTLCLACHQEQKAHYVAGDCATCHAVPGPPRPHNGSGR